MKKYLLFGNGESPHLVKWVKALNEHYELYLASSQGVADEIKELIPAGRMFSFNLDVKESGGNVVFFRTLLPLMRIIRRTSPDIVNAHYITSHGFIAALAKTLLRKNFFLVLSAWGTDILVTPGRNAMYSAITRFALRKAGLITSDSVAVTARVSEMATTPVMTFPFGLDRLPAASFADKDPSLYFSNRTLNENSNIGRVLELFRDIAANDPDARLIIANEGSRMESLRALSEEMKLGGKVEFKGFLKAAEQDEIYRKAQYYFSIPSSDALSVSLLEAMARGCIPILSDLPDNRDWVEHGRNGVILGPGIHAGLIRELNLRAPEIFVENRKIVTERGLFPGAIKKLTERLASMTTK